MVSLLQLNGFEVFEFSQIPQLHNRVISSSGQVVTIRGIIAVNQTWSNLNKEKTYPFSEKEMLVI